MVVIRATIVSLLSVRSADRILDVDNLISVCTKKLQEDPTHKKALFIRASSFLKKGRFAEAIQDCNSLMKLDPQNAGAFYIRGCAFEKLSQLE